MPVLLLSRTWVSAALVTRPAASPMPRGGLMMLVEMMVVMVMLMMLVVMVMLMVVVMVILR